MRTLFVSISAVALLVGALFAQDALQRNQAQPEDERTFTTNDGQTIRGALVNEGSTDIQVRQADGRIRLLRKIDGGRVRVVTSQTDWPTYNGQPGGNRYSTLKQISKSNVAKLAPAWMFPIGNVTQVETTPLVVEGVMYFSSANEVWAVDAGSGRQIWHYRRARTQGIAATQPLASIGVWRGKGTGFSF